MNDQRCAPCAKDFEVLVLASPFDEGVVNNNGRPGAKGGPQSIKNRLEKLYAHDHLKKYGWVEIDKAPPHPLSQNIPLSKKLKLLHLGGGHDTIVQALEILNNSSLYKKNSSLMVNFDPHPDVRDPSVYGWTSGGGFFQLRKNFPIFSKYLLIGAQEQNISKNHIDLVDEILWFQDIPRTKRVPFVINHLKKALLKHKHFFLSFDLDCIQDFVGVSAPCGYGFEYADILEIIDSFKNHPKLMGMGVYELSPSLDLTPLSVIKAANLVYRLLIP